MKRLLALIAILIPICALTQGFGSFSRDQPFLAGGGTTIPGIPPVLAFHWKASDISTNDPIATWTDRVSGFNLIQTNSIYRPTNSSFGVCFDGSKSLEFATSLKIPTNSSVFVSGYFSTMPHNQIVVYSTNGNEGFFLNTTNKVTFRYGGNDYVGSVFLNPTNLTTIGFTSEKVSTNVSLVTYINGSQNSSNFFTGTNTSLDTVGGWSGLQWGTVLPRLDYSLSGFITDIYVWTNAVLNLQNAIYLDALADSLYASTKEPFFNPNSITGLVLYARSDAPEISGTGGSGGHINGISVTNAPDSYNPNGAIDKYFGSAGTVVWNTNTGPSGRPAFRLTGNSGLDDNHTAVSVAQPTTYFFVFQCTNTTGFQAILSGGSGGNKHTVWPSQASPALVLETPGVGGVYASPLASTNWIVLTACFSGSSSWARTNGVSIGPMLSGSIGTDPFRAPGVFGNNSDLLWPLKGFYCEVIAYSGAALTTNNIATVERYLMDKYDPSTNIWSR